MISDKYKADLQQHRQDHQEWGGSAVRNAGDHVVRYINKHDEIHTVLDFGCGTGTLGDYVRQHCPGVRVVSYDPSIPGIDTIDPTILFDLIVSVDVLEHVEPKDLATTIAWMRSNSQRQFHHIDCNETNSRLPDGRDVHLIVKPPEWWEAQLSYTEVADGWNIMERHVHDKRKRSRFPRTSCTFIFERQG
jgi:SAM-dependent methyltransferase